MRLFVAVDVPGDVKDAIERDVVDPLRDVLPGAKWTRPDGRHLTLKFLGNVEDERVHDVAAALRPVGAVAPFNAAFGDIGGFPNLRRPRVLWIGVETGRDALVDLAEAVEQALSPLGFPPEDRPFHPHLTLARFTTPRVIDPSPSVALEAAPFRIGEVVLFRSHLHPKGARYSVVDTVLLDGG